MKKNKLTVGQMARLNHTTVATLKLYEKMGLLEPDFVDPDNGYRYYDVTQSVVFRAIQYNVNLSLSLRELEEVIRQNDYDIAAGFYGKAVDHIEQELKMLEEKRGLLQKTIGWLKHYQQLPPAGTMTLEYLEPQYVYALPALRNYFLEDFGSYVYGIAKLTDCLEEAHIPCCYQYFTCMTMAKDDFLSGHYQTQQIGTYINEAYAAYPEVNLQKGQMYACAYLDDFAGLPDSLAALKAYCEERNYEVQGDIICRLLGSLSLQDFRQPAPFLRLQVPVKIPPAAAAKNNSPRSSI